MVPQNKICTTGGYNSCPPHLDPSITILLSYFRVEKDFSHFILFLSSLLSRWASRHHKLQYAFYAASHCLWDPFLPRLKQAHSLPHLDFPAAETLQIQLYCAPSKPEEEAAASPSWTGHGAPVPQGLWP